MAEMTLKEFKERCVNKPLKPQKIFYRTDHTFERAPYPEFSEYEDRWVFDEEKGLPVVVGRDNIQEKIQSYEDCALDVILDKYLKDDNVEEVAAAISSPGVLPDDGARYVHVSPDLADLGEEYERVETLKAQYNLDPALSYDETLKVLRERKADLDAHIVKLQSKQKEAEKKEIEEHEKTQDKQKEKQEIV